MTAGAIKIKFSNASAFNDLWLGLGNAASEMKSEFGFSDRGILRLWSDRWAGNLLIFVLEKGNPCMVVGVTG